MIKFAGYFSLTGFIIPLIFTITWELLEKFPNFYIMIGHKVQLIQLALWPSSIFMIATAGTKGINYKILTISIVANITFYAMLGLLTWFGLNKHRWILVVTSVIVLLLLYRLLTL
jgi:hypothetical protein